MRIACVIIKLCILLTSPRAFLFVDNVMKSTRENEKVAKDFFDRQDKDQDGRISKVSYQSDLHELKRTVFILLFHCGT